MISLKAKCMEVYNDATAHLRFCRETGRSMAMAKKGQSGKMVNYLVGAVVVVTLFAGLAPTIFNTLAGLKEEANLSTGDKAMVGLVGTLLIIGIFYGLYRFSGVGRKN